MSIAVKKGLEHAPKCCFYVYQLSSIVCLLSLCNNENSQGRQDIKKDIKEHRIIPVFHAPPKDSFLLLKNLGRFGENSITYSFTLDIQIPCEDRCLNL